MRLAHDLLIKTKGQSDVVPGNIYPAKGGRKTPGTEWWLVVAVSASGAHCIGFGEDGRPVSTANYLKSALRERPIVGRCDLDAVQLNVKGDEV